MDFGKKFKAFMSHTLMCRWGTPGQKFLNRLIKISQFTLEVTSQLRPCVAHSTCYGLRRQQTRLKIFASLLWMHVYDNWIL